MAMFDRLLLPLLALIAVVLIAVALAWPQGLGRPTPFSRPANAVVSHDRHQNR